jgi:hypothetical protein
MTARPARPARARTQAEMAAAPPTAPRSLPRALRLPERPLAGAVARARAREAGIERAVMGGALLLALTASGFAGYVIAGQSRPYAVQAVMPAETRPFAWKRAPAAPARAAIPDLDPTTTGAIPERAAPAAPDQPEPAAEAGYSLLRAGAGSAELQGAAGRVQVSTGSELPGAGRVLAIRNTGAGWVVITTQTIIGPTRL